MGSRFGTPSRFQGLIFRVNASDRPPLLSVIVTDVGTVTGAVNTLMLPRLAFEGIRNEGDAV